MLKVIDDVLAFVADIYAKDDVDDIKGAAEINPYTWDNDGTSYANIAFAMLFIYFALIAKG